MKNNKPLQFDFSPKVPVLPAALEVILSPQLKTEVIRLVSGQRQCLLGIGEPKSVTRRKLILIARQAIQAAKTAKLSTVVIHFPDFLFPALKIAPADVAELLATNFEMANFEFVTFKSKPADDWQFVEQIIVAGTISAPVKRGFAAGAIIGRHVNACRALANTPGGTMTPTRLAEAARIAIRGQRIEMTVLAPTQLRAQKMGGILGVSQGSIEPPRFIILEYRGGRAGTPPVVLVGKGVTFDTGGLNLKPDEAMYQMHLDMSGGAAVIQAIAAAAELKFKKNIIALIPAVENMPSGSSYRPGDIITSMSGKTIEVLNTDAEGRIILADALTYAQRYKPSLVVDVATLTGAAMSALGQRASAVFTTTEKLEHMFRQLGEESGDYVWPLPLWSEYEKDIEGTFGDWANSGKTRYGGAIAGAMFLYQFIKEYPWVHLDIAPRMTAVDDEFLAKGAAGTPVRLLIKLLQRI